MLEGRVGTQKMKMKEAEGRKPDSPWQEEQKLILSPKLHWPRAEDMRGRGEENFWNSTLGVTPQTNP